MKRELVTLAATLGLTLAAAASPVGVYINDDFTGSSLNTAVWTATGSVSVKDSYVTVQANYSDARLSSIATVSPGTRQVVELTMKSVSANDGWPSCVSFGLFNSSGKGTIDLESYQNWSYPNGTYLAICGSGASDTTMYYAIPYGVFYGAATTPADFTIDWSTNGVVLKKNGTVIFDSTVNAPTYGGTAWVLPTANMGVWVDSYVNTLSLATDKITLEVIPEPAVASLLLLGGAVFGLRRRRG